MIERDVQELGLYVSDIVDRLNMSDSLDSKGEKKTVNQSSFWRIDSEDHVRNVWNILEIVDVAYLLKEKIVQEALKLYDGYLIPLSKKRWVKILLNQEKIMGCVYYDKDTAFRVLSDGNSKSFICQSYKVRNIRGSEYFQVVH